MNSMLSIILSLLRERHRLSNYVLSLRISSFSSSLIPVLIGAVLAYKCNKQFSPNLLLATLFTVMSVHSAANLINTYYDFVRGVDSSLRSDDRTLVDQHLTPDQVVNLGVTCYLFGCIGFVMMAYLSSARMPHLALIYFVGLSFSFLYTAGLGLKYIALGDVIMLTFGPISALFSFIAQTGSLDQYAIPITYAIPLALNTEAIHHSNNTRDIENDRELGVVTIAILIGHSASHILFALLLFIPYIMFTVTSFSFHYSFWLLLPLITLPKAFKLEKQFRDGNLKFLPKSVAKLNIYFGLFYLIAILMSSACQLPGLSNLIKD